MTYFVRRPDGGVQVARKINEAIRGFPVSAEWAEMFDAKEESRAFCATGQGNGIDNSCGAKTMPAPDKDGGGGKGGDYDPGHFDVGPDPNGLTEKDLMYSPTVKWTQDHKSLVRDAVKSWKGSPTDMTLHVMSELKGDGTPGSGSGKIMRAQATALLTEVLDNGEPAPTLYRGASIPPEQDSSPLLGWTSKKSVAEAFAKKNNGEVYTLEGATGLNTSKIKAHGMGEAEWIVAHNIPYGYQVYHGTNADDPESLDFNEVSKSTNSTDLGDYDTTRHGVFFSDSKAFASEYGKNVGKFSLDLKSVADLTTPAGGNHSDVVHQFLDSLDAAGNENNRRVYLTALHSNPWKPWLMFEGDVGEKFVSWLKDEGYDAARFKEYTGNDVGGNTTVVFDKKKIKPKKEGRAFCPTGVGGGIKNDCGPGQTAKSFPEGSQNLRDAVDSVAPAPEQVWDRSRGLAETPAPKQMDDIANEQTSYSGAPLAPEAEASYGSLVDEIGRQYEALTAAGLKARAWRGEGEPYGDPPGSTKPNSDKMRQEVAKTGEFSFFMTDKGFGTGDATPNHPMLRETKFKTADGEPMIANDLFRVVHDMVAHVRGGYSFSTNGEYNGMLTHASTLPEEAWPALFAETFGQNAVYEKTKNYAPQNAYASKVGPEIIRSELKKRNKSSRAAKDDGDEPLGYQHIKSRPALLKSLVESRAADCARDDDGRFASGNRCGGSVDMPKEDPKGRMRYDNGVQTDAARKLYQMGSSEKRLKSLVDVMGGDPKNTRVDINPPSLNISVSDKDGNKLFHVDFENGRARLYPAKDLSPAEAKKIKEAAGEAFGGRQADTTIKVFSKAADMKRWDSENAAKLKKWEDKYAFSTLLPPHQRPKKWERSLDAKHASLLAFVQSRGFCPNGEGGGVTNTCSSKDSSSPEPESDDPLPALHLLAESDADAPHTKIKSGDGEVTVFDRTGISTPDYLDEIECHGRNCGLDVTFEEAKQLQPDSDIKDDWSPLDAYVGPGAGYFTGYSGSLGENADGSIDHHGADYGTIDDYYASDLLAEKQKEVEKEWDEMSDDEKNVASMKLLYGVDASPSDEDDVVALREAGKKQWMDDNTSDIEESINAMREEARQNAVKQMAKELESAVAEDTIECCLQLYRGLRVDPAEVDRMISSGYVVHENVNSWTTSRDVSRSFGASRLLLVTRKPRVGHIFSSNAHSEMEVVRPPSRMRILGVVRTSTGTVLHVDEDEDYKGA